MHSKQKYILHFFIILLIKCGYVVFLVLHFNHYLLSDDLLKNAKGDTPTYIVPIENFIHDGNYGMYMSEYTPFKSTLEPKFYRTIRTPYYGIIYYIFRLILPPNAALYLLVALQLLIEALSIIIFSILVRELTRKNAGYYISLFFLTFSAWVTFYAGDIATESLTCSFILIGITCFYFWLKENKVSLLLMSGLLLGYAILMKPFLIGFVLFILLAIVIHKKGIIKAFRPSLLFCLPFMVLLTPWVVRNYVITGEAILFSKPMYYPCKKLVIACGTFLNAWGGDAIWWEGKCKTAGTFFYPSGENKYCEYEFPDRAFTPDYDLEDLRILRNQIAIFEEDPTNDSLDIVISKKFDELTASYIKHRPFQYYVVAPLMRFKNAFVKSGSYFIIPRNLPLQALRIFQSLLYLIPLTFGALGFLFYGITRIRKPEYLVLVGLPVSLVSVLILILQLHEWRYFIYIYPINVLFLTIFFLNRIDWYREKIKTAV